ncbi:LEA type 2 family protein [Bacteroidota bacterium]
MKKIIRMKIKNIIGIILIVVILGSCNAYESINIGNVNNVNLKGMVENKISLELQVPVSNPNGFKIKIKSMDLDVTLNGDYLGNMKNANEIIIPAKSDQVQNILVDVYVKNPLASMAVMYKLRKSKNIEMQIEGTIKVKAFLRSKTVKVSEKQNVNI